MQYLIFSDSHGGGHKIAKVLERCYGGIDGIIFLGDVCTDVDYDGILRRQPELAETCLWFTLPRYVVAGNCDGEGKYLDPEYHERMLELDGVRVLILHGHRQSVKSGTSELEAYARRQRADVVLFGHTHERYYQYVDGIKPLHIFNPGAVTMPRDGIPSFGTLTIKNGQILLAHGDVYAK